MEFMMGSLKGLTSLPPKVCLLLLMSLSATSALSTFAFEKRPCFGATCGEREHVTHVKGLLDCVRHCRLDHSCVGVSSGSNPNTGGESRDEDCYIHRSGCDTSQACSPVYGQMVMYVKLSESIGRTWPTLSPQDNKTNSSSELCQNGGQWNTIMSRCVCKDGWVGEKCHTLAEHCLDLINDGYPLGNHDVNLQPSPSQNPFRTVCKLAKNFARMFVFRSSGRLSFNKTWADYEEGFFYDIENMWLGLKNIHLQCTNGSHDLIMDAVYTTGWERTRHKNFFVGNSSTGYSVNTGGTYFFYDGYVDQTGGDRLKSCLKDVTSLPFSTYDSDNSLCPEKDCASRAGAGWWFAGCDVKCNPLGLRYDNPPQPLADDRVLLPGLNHHDSGYAGNYLRVEATFTREK